MTEANEIYCWSCSVSHYSLIGSIAQITVKFSLIILDSHNQYNQSVEPSHHEKYFIPKLSKFLLLFDNHFEISANSI